ncbi:MAG: acetyltransferase [Bacteroidetes bacterium]|nr:acetyltransferase [Bacteroidota bacterium]
MKNEFNPDELKLIEQVKIACYKQAKLAFDEAAISGLCLDGVIEIALDAIKNLRLDQIQQP